MNLFRRRRWPKELERREPENAATPEQIEAQHQKLVAARAELAIQQTADNQLRIAQVAATVRGLTSRLGS